MITRWRALEGGGRQLQMRCLSLKQPYPYLIFDLPPEHRKDVENRTSSVTSEMGAILIHASAGMSRSYYEEAYAGALKRGVPKRLLPDSDQLERGVLYGAVRFGEHLPPRSLMDPLWKWKFVGSHGYTLSRATRLPPRPLSGRQTLFFVDISEAERELLRAAGLQVPLP